MTRFLLTQKKAKKGDKVAQFELGKMYHFGDGIEKDKSEAHKWFIKSAEQGYAEAQYISGLSLVNGDGVSANVDKGLELLYNAANQGFSEAQFGLGIMLMSFGNEDLYKEGANFLMDAAEQGNENAITVLMGVAKPQDRFTEIMTGALHGDVDAQYQIAVCYFMGEEVEKNCEQAAHWFRQAAEQGHAEAQLSLARMYFDGLGIDVDYKESAIFFVKAAEQGNEIAKESLEIPRIKEKLSNYLK
jgi:TPR repeat protein